MSFLLELIAHLRNPTDMTDFLAIYAQVGAKRNPYCDFLARQRVGDFLNGGKRHLCILYVFCNELVASPDKLLQI